ncbi:uncharacterized protein BKA55DRAFT_545320 [Fusarium redolens]|uniref:Uncharacterized protein n=1 Tax=Fusarium redolens TaxID=48865 RepID=A0A9P9G169_FUSRE|nr:uncharacterized protein BKA55DRAFT_545320 [Fusarium redolens]KAH7230626.1 hypothetical protein BKA55DRAFT_545320 [Fusarium redolens]
MTLGSVSEALAGCTSTSAQHHREPESRSDAIRLWDHGSKWQQRARGSSRLLNSSRNGVALKTNKLPPFSPVGGKHRGLRFGACKRQDAIKAIEEAADLVRFDDQVALLIGFNGD